MVGYSFLLINRWGRPQAVGDAVSLTVWGMGATASPWSPLRSSRIFSAERWSAKRSAGGQRQRLKLRTCNT